MNKFSALEIAISKAEYDQHWKTFVVARSKLTWEEVADLEHRNWRGTTNVRLRAVELRAHSLISILRGAHWNFSVGRLICAGLIFG